MALGPIKARGEIEERERVPATAALAGAAPRALSKPAPLLRAQSGAGSLSRPLHLRQLPKSVPSPRPPPRHRPPAGGSARQASPRVPRPPPRPPRKSLRWPGGPRPDLRRWGRGAPPSVLGGAETPALRGARGSVSEHSSRPPGASEQRPLCSRFVPLPGRPESHGCGIGEGEETGRGRYPASAWNLGGGRLLRGVQRELRQPGAPGGGGPLPAHLPL